MQALYLIIITVWEFSSEAKFALRTKMKTDEVESFIKKIKFTEAAAHLITPTFLKARRLTLN